jgi:hypothetical protein
MISHTIVGYKREIVKSYKFQVQFYNCFQNVCTPELLLEQQ